MKILELGRGRGVVESRGTIRQTIDHRVEGRRERSIFPYECSDSHPSKFVHTGDSHHGLSGMYGGVCSGVF